MAMSAFAQKDEFVGIYSGKDDGKNVFGEVYRAYDDSYRLRIFEKAVSPKGNILFEEASLKAKNGSIIAKHDDKIDLTVLPTEINGNFRENALRLAKIVYQSPTMGMKAPKDAVMLFDGKDLKTHWTMGKKELNWIIKDDIATIDNASKSGGIKTKDSYGALRLHLEFKTPAEYDGESQQKRGNSGIKFGPYEIQILDSFGNLEYNEYDVGAIYSRTKPMVNAGLEPDAWQTFDIEFSPVKYKENGEIDSLPVFTVYLNGILVHLNVEVEGPTNAKEKKNPDFKHPEKVQLELQNHRHDVSFRNIWLVETK